MNKDFKNTMIASLLVVFVAGLIISSMVLGKFLNPFIIIVVCELTFNFILIPSIIKNYYNLHSYEAPDIYKRYCPFYNVTIIMSPRTARLSIFSFMILIIMFVLSMNISVLSFLGDRIFLNIVDYAGLCVSLVGFVHFIFVGFGLGGASLKVKGLYKDFFSEDDLEGGAKFFSSLLSTSKYLEVILFMLPVVRIIPVLTLKERCADLIKFGAYFEGDYDPHNDEVEDDVYEYDEE